MLNVPFFINEGNRCMQTSMRSALAYYLGKDYSLNELDILTGRFDDQWTWTPQAVSVLSDLGLKVKYYSKTPLEKMLNGESYIREMYGAQADEIIKLTNLPGLHSSVKNLINLDLFSQEILPFSKIEKHIDNHQLPIMLLDFGLIDDKNRYQGHFVCVTGYDSEKVYFHDSGPRNPRAHCNLKKEDFIAGWNSNGTDNDLILILGIRSNFK